MSPTEPIQAAAPDVALRAESPRTTRRPSPAPWRFPGCRPIHLSREDITDYEGRLEFWDAELETAWVMEPTSPYHESPSQILAALVDRIAAVRGSPIRCFGTMDLLLRDEAGERRRILQADQAVYLHPVEGEPAGEGGDGHRRACVSGRGDGGGLLDRRAAEQARVVRIVGVPGGVAGRSGGAPEESSAESCAGADDLPARRRRLPGSRGEPGRFPGGVRRRFTSR